MIDGSSIRQRIEDQRDQALVSLALNLLDDKPNPLMWSEKDHGTFHAGKAAERRLKRGGDGKVVVLKPGDGYERY